MPTVREYFVKEAADYLEQLRLWLDAAAAGSVDAAALQRICRSLRGSAQIAREERVQRAAAAFESAARGLAAGTLVWDPNVAHASAATLADLRQLVTGDADEAEAERLAAQVAARWHADGAGGAAPGAGDEGRAAPPASAPSPGEAATGGAPSEFERYAAREAAGVLRELDLALQVLRSDPLDREPLKQILRQQRALQGAAQLESLPELAGTMRTLEDVTRLVARTGAAVEGEWLAFYQAAREVLAPEVAALERGEPRRAGGVEDLVARSERLAEGQSGGQRGQAEPPAPSAAAAGEAAGAPSPGAPAPSAAEDAGSGPVPIEELLYRGDAALERALELRPFIERAVRDDADAHAAVEELFDLIRLGRA